MNLAGLRLLKLLGVPTEDGSKIRDATIEIAPDALTTVVVRYYAELEDANEPITPINREFYVREKQPLSVQEINGKRFVQVTQERR